MLGIALGAIGVVAFSRYRKRSIEEDAEALIDNLSKQLESLEEGTKATIRRVRPQRVR